ADPARRGRTALASSVSPAKRFRPRRYADADLWCCPSRRPCRSPSSMTAFLNALGVICALGRGKAEVAARLLAGDVSGMQPYPQPVAGRTLPVGMVTGELPNL